MSLKTVARFGLFAAFLLSPLAQTFAQESTEVTRPRRVVSNTPNITVQQPSVQQKTIVVPSAQNQQSERPLTSTGVYSRPANRPALVTVPTVKQTAAVRPANAATANALNTMAANSMAAFRGRMLQAMNNWYGTPYNYGSEGPKSIDCSALVWRVFGESGVKFDRTSAATMWANFPAATEEEKTQFGTLVFFNRLGHVGIMIDENTFFHASSSKGVTFSKLEGYWEKRVVGYRRVPLF